MPDVMNATQMSGPRIAYIAFDVVPAPKGAAIHIQAFTQGLSQHFGQLNLVTVSPTEAIMTQELGPGITQTALPALGKTLIDRVLHFRRGLKDWLATQEIFDVIQVRSPFEGFPIALQKSDYCRKLIFEVNGLPSIELKYRYPQVAEDPELMHKLLAQEDICLQAADCIVTPSPVTQGYLIQRGVEAKHIQVIANGVDLALFHPAMPRSQPQLEQMRLLYFGTLSTWQGVDLAVDALALYRRDFEARLTVVGPGKASQLKRLDKLAQKLDVADWIDYLGPMSPEALVQQMHQADVIVAPLKACDRNLIQGCCPLKVLEGMASGTPVITTEMPVVQALGIADQHFLAVKPNSSKGIKDAMLRLRDNSKLRLHLSQQGRAQVEQHYSWEIANGALVQTYERLLGETR